jgi:hypothetical protein
MKRTHLWFTILSLAWAVLQPAVFILRFRRLPPLWEALYFVPMGILSAAFVIYLTQRAANRATRVSTIIGYLVASPFALVGGLGGGHFIHPIIGVTIMGTIPLVLGAAAGYALGKLTTRISAS